MRRRSPHLRMLVDIIHSNPQVEDEKKLDIRIRGDLLVRNGEILLSIVILVDHRVDTTSNGLGSRDFVQLAVRRGLVCRQGAVG